MSVLDLVPRIREAVSVSTDYETDILPALVRRQISRLLRDYDFPKMLARQDYTNLPAGTQSFTLPDGYKKPVAVMFYDPTAVVQYSPSGYTANSAYSRPLRRMEVFEPATLGYPDAWSQQGNTFILNAPLPADSAGVTLQLYYLNMDEEYNEAWITQDFGDVIFSLSCYRFGAENSKTEVMQAFASLWQEDQQSLAKYANELEFAGVEVLQREARWTGQDCRYPSWGGLTNPAGSAGNPNPVSGTPAGSDPYPAVNYGIADVPNDGNVYVRSFKAWLLAGSVFNTILEAPVDGGYYVRHNQGWQAGVPEAPADGRPYARQLVGQAMAWNYLNFDNFTTDPPQDGKSYQRSGKQWVLPSGTGKIDPQDFANNMGNFLVFIQEFYTAADGSTRTDAQALQAAFTAVAAAGIDATICFKPNGGKGTGGRYFIDQLVEYRGNNRIELDGMGSLIRFVGNTACIRYTCLPTSALNVMPEAFYVRRFSVQVNGTAVQPFHWNFPFKNSRVYTTGGVADMRFAPYKSDDSATDAFDACIKLTNTWLFTCERCFAVQKPKVQGSLVAGSNFLRTEGLCVEVNQVYCQTAYFDVATKIGWAELDTFNSTSVTAGVVFGTKVTQGNAVGYMAVLNGTSIGAYTYAIYNQGTTAFAAGQVTWYAADGVTVGGTFNIDSTTHVQRPPEAFHFLNCTPINCNYSIDATMPDTLVPGLTETLINITDGQINGYSGCFKGTHIGGMVVSGVQVAVANNAVAFYINNSNSITFSGNTFLGNGSMLGGTAIQLRNTVSFEIGLNDFTNLAVPTDIDNTCKDGVVSSNGGTGSGLLLNTANRYNGVSTRGIRYVNNGALGVGIDINDPTLKTYTPTVTAQSGAIGAYTATGTYVLNGGVLVLTVSVQVTDVGGAAGVMYVTLPPPFNQLVGITLPDTVGTVINASASSPPALRATASVNALGTSKPGIGIGPSMGGGNGPFYDNNGSRGGFNYIISFSIPVRAN